MNPRSSIPSLLALLVWAIIIVAFSAYFMLRARGDVLQLQDQRWHVAHVRSEWKPVVDKALWQFSRDKARYDTITAMRKGGVPAIIVFALHGRESSWSFKRHLHEGSLLQYRTRDVPKGRPRTPEPPYTWERSAEDALYLLKDMEMVNWMDMPTALQAIEKFNGLGYQYKGLVSPYVWSGTTIYDRGKYVRDHVFSAQARDEQLGCAVVLVRYFELYPQPEWNPAGR